MNINKNKKLLLIISLAFIVYGYSARLFSISFFWESLYIGFFLLLLYFYIVLYVKRQTKKKKIHFILQVVITLFFIIYSTITIILFNSDSYSVAKEFIKTNPQITLQIGEVDNWGYLINGSIENVEGKRTSELRIIAKGKKRISEILILMHQGKDQIWEVSYYDILY